jgi:hypothetical protein
MFCGRCTNGYRGEEGNDRRPCRACHRHNRIIREYAEELASHMGLADWTIEVRHDPTEVDTYAEIECVYGQRLARIGLNRNWLTYTREMQRDTLVHELVHATLAPLSQMAYDMVDALTENEGAQAAAKAALSGSEEWVVDPISIAWAPHLPLPEEQ